MDIRKGMAAIDDAQLAIQQRRRDLVEAAIDRIFQAATAASGDDALFLGANGYYYAGVLALVCGDAGAATTNIEAGLEVVGMIQDAEQRSRLLSGLLHLKSDVLCQSGGIADGQDAMEAALEALLGGLGIARTTDLVSPAGVSAAIPDPEGLLPADRSALAVLLMALAERAFVRRTDGQTVAWLKAADPFIRTLPSDGPTFLIGQWGEMSRATAARWGAEGQITDLLEDESDLHRLVAASPEIAEAQIEISADFARLTLAMAIRDRSAMKEALAVIASRPWFETMGDDKKRQHRAMEEWLATGRFDWLGSLSDADDRGQPGYYMGRLAKAHWLLAQDTDLAAKELVDLFADPAFEHNHDLGIGVPMGIFFALGRLCFERGLPLVAAATLFGKAGVRRCEAVRLDLAKYAPDELSPLANRQTLDAYGQLRDILLSQGRVGEAIRVDVLLAQKERRMPLPAHGDLLAALASRIPYTPGEARAWATVVETAGLIARGETTVSPLQWLEGLSAFLPDRPSSGAASDLDRGPWENPIGVARIGFIPANGRLRVRVAHGAVRYTSDTGFCSLRDLSVAVYELEKALRFCSPDVLGHSKRLFDSLLRPVAGVLAAQAIHTLIVEGHGPVMRIPFAALHDGGAYLLERFAIVYHGRQSEASGENIGVGRAVSFAVSKAPGREQLRHARHDFASLKEILGPDKVEGLVDEDASPAALSRAMSRPPAIVQISCHFENDPADMGRSSFVLAGGQKYALAALAVHDLRPVKLMLLLGCETAARNDASNGTGVDGLDAALLRMGVESVLGTLFDLDDAVANYLLKSFLIGCMVDKKSRAEALRVAQLSLLRGDNERFRHPHYWAVVILSGEDGPL